MAFRTNKMPVLQNKSASGAIASFDTILTKPLEECTSLITGYQEGSGTPSPSNIRPLVSFSSASLGKCDNNTASLWSIDNSFNGDVEFNQLVKNGNFVDKSNWSPANSAVLTVENNTLTVEKTKSTNTVFYQTINVTKDHYYYISCFVKPSETANVGFSNALTSPYKQMTAGVMTNYCSIVTASFSYDNIALRFDYSGGVGSTIDVENIYITDLTSLFERNPSIADYIYNLEQTTTGAGVAFFKALYPEDYYAYNAGTKQLVGDTLATFTFGQSIYQGYIDWKRGVVVGTWVMKDLGALNWTKELNHFYSNIFLDAKYPPNNSTVADILCENYQAIAENNVANEAVDNSIGMSETGRIYIYDSSLSSGDATAFTSAVTGINLAYELATPIEIPLGGINLLTQQGVNNIFADTGDVDLTYKDLDIAKRGNFREVFRLPS